MQVMYKIVLVYITGAQWSSAVAGNVVFFSKMTFLTPESDTTPQKLA
jgi:hypothetical protein